jgi:hypothetical protein
MRQTPRRQIFKHAKKTLGAQDAPLSPPRSDAGESLLYSLLGLEQCVLNVESLALHMFGVLVAQGCCETRILVSRFGIFVIETKDYKGWIFAGQGDRSWTQVLYRAKFRFQNPLRQNHRHVRAIQGLLDFLPADVVRSVVVFTGDAEFKTNIPDGVFTVAGFLAFVEGATAEFMSANRVQFCVGCLETTLLSITKATDVEHVQGLRRRYGNDQ